MVTADRVTKLIAYDPDSGALTRIFRTSNSVKIGDKAGAISNHGYVRVSLDNKFYLAHRLAWLIMTGEWPDDQIDHINGIRHDNRWANLRQATNQENGKNQALRSTNKSGVTGVDWHSITGKWRAQITVNGKAVYLGVFTDIRDAEEARKTAEIKFAFHKNHGRTRP